jgi:hypothetical protein
VRHPAVTSAGRPPVVVDDRALLAEQIAEVKAAQGAGSLGVRLVDDIAKGSQDEVLQHLDVIGIDDRRIDVDVLELEIAGGANPHGAAAGSPLEHFGGGRGLRVLKALLDLAQPGQERIEVGNGLIFSAHG